MRMFRMLLPYLAVLIIGGCGARTLGSGSSESVALPLQIAVTNESGVTRRFELLVNGVVVLDTIVARPRDLTGRVLSGTVWIAPGDYDMVLIDHYRHERFKTRLVSKPTSMFVAINLMASKTLFTAGYGLYLFM
jgi:hypothetical protein